MNTLVTYRKVARIVGESASLRGCIQEIFYFLPKVEIICVLFLSTVLFSNSSEVDRRQKESVVIGRQSNVVATCLTASNGLQSERCHRLLRRNRVERGNVGKIHIV